MRKTASLLSVLMLLCTLALAQTRTVSGVVKDEKGDPIPFATIAETGTKLATQADANGIFSIKIPESAQLTVTAAGYKAQTLKPGMGSRFAGAKAPITKAAGTHISAERGTRLRLLPSLPASPRPR